MTNPLEREYEYYVQNREKLAAKYHGKLVAIKGQKVLGAYDDYLTAAKSVYVEHERGTVLMQEISRDPEALVVILQTPGIAAFQ